jgi:hypothetical protein
VGDAPKIHPSVSSIAISSVNPGSTGANSKFCLFTHGDARRTGASTSKRIGSVLARIAFSEVQHRGEKALS